MEEAESSSNSSKQIDNILEKLTSLVSAKSTKGVNRLEDECSSLRAVLNDLEVQNQHLDLSELLQQLKPAYDRIQNLYSEQEVSSCSFLLWRRLALAREIKHLSSVLEKFRNGEEWKSVETCVLDSIKSVNRYSTSHKGNPARREEDKKNILGRLLGYSPRTIKYVPVVSIYGARGLGKTKLAEAIFEDDSVVKEFKSLRFWVNVGVEFDLKNVIRRIIECLVKSRIADLSLDTLKDLLVKIIFEKKFLLVLDDFSSEDTEKWDDLMQCLKWGVKKSRIIVVARTKSVAEKIRPLAIFVISRLDIDEALVMWDFDVPKGDEFDDVKKKIASSCNQNPLTVEVIGKLLKYKPLEAELLPFMRQVQKKLFVPDPSPLRVSYSYLAPQLQKCFLYCGLFPRGEDVDVEKLIHHWMAQQYIIRPKGAAESMEEIGLEYFKYLVKRSFLRERKRDELGNTTTCKLDDLMHDLATELAAGLGHRVVKEPKEKENMEEFNDINTRHVSFPFHLNSKLTEKCSFNAQRLRTFLLPMQDIMKSNEGQLPGIVRSSFVFGSSFPFIFKNSFSQDMLTRFKELYVCDLHSSGIVKVPSCIQKLECLRYLDISDNDEIKFLPKAITKLHFLQVLNVSGCEMLEKLPKKICKLINLHHLYCHRCWNLKYMPYGIGQLTELRTLSWFVVVKDSSLFAHIGGLEELEGLVNLREVEITNLKHLKGGNSEFQKAKINKKKHLQSLTLCWNHDEDDDVIVDVVAFDLGSNKNLQRLKLRDYKGVTFPVELSLLKNLVHISMKNFARCASLPPLDHIESLKCLSIENFPCLVYIDYKENNAHGQPSNLNIFNSLDQLCLVNCPNLIGWAKAKDNEDYLAVLGKEYFTSTEIKGCPKFMPEFPKAKDKSTVVMGQQQHKLLNVKRAEAIIRDIIQSDQGNDKTQNKWEGSVIIENVKSFPEELLKNKSSFQKLHINNCPELSSLPEALKDNDTLQELEISGCPNIEKRCRNKNRQDWHIVSHIPYIQINGKYITTGRTISID